MNHNIKSSVFTISLIALSTVFVSATYAAPSSGEMKAKLEKIDVNSDGKVSRDEAAKYKGVAKHFDNVDANNDGYLTKDEMKAQRAKSIQAKFRAIDGNQDGRISRAEADAKTPKIAQHFDKLDTNKDGYIDKNEMAEARQQREHRQRK
ncbi:MAG: hypothetical protein HC782_03925 [Gammaproteobacteria bacterium]|nr:hypothetical protein [Gammaproteobacteria bacterium]